MDKDSVILELEDMLRGYLTDKQLELVDLIYRREGSNLMLRIIVDRPAGGITLDDCTFLNKEFGRILDEKDIIAGKYILEVSSPGLDRPLVNKRDFIRCVNRRVKVFLNEPVNNKIELDGVIKEVGDDCIYLEVKADVVRIELEKINKAKQAII